MCHGYSERTQRLEERRRREFPGQQLRQADGDPERATLEELDGEAPEEPTENRDEQLPD